MCVFPKLNNPNVSENWYLDRQTIKSCHSHKLQDMQHTFFEDGNASERNHFFDHYAKVNGRSNMICTTRICRLAAPVVKVD
jgi:hypothetical protein